MVNQKAKGFVEQFKNFLRQSSLPGHDMNLHNAKHYKNILAHNNFSHYANGNLLTIFSCKILHYTTFKSRNVKYQLNLRTKKMF